MHFLEGDYYYTPHSRQDEMMVLAELCRKYHSSELPRNMFAERFRKYHSSKFPRSMFAERFLQHRHLWIPQNSSRAVPRNPEMMDLAERLPVCGGDQVLMRLPMWSF